MLGVWDYLTVPGIDSMFSLGVIKHIKVFLRGIAQSGRVLALGARSQRFKSSHPDFFSENFLKGEIWKTFEDG